MEPESDSGVKHRRLFSQLAIFDRGPFRQDDLEKANMVKDPIFRSVNGSIASDRLVGLLVALKAEGLESTCFDNGGPVRVCLMLSVLGRLEHLLLSSSNSGCISFQSFTRWFPKVI